MEDLINLLHEGNHSLVVANGDVVTFDGRGVSDLYNLFREDPSFLDGADVADKVVGKGAAALMISGKIHAVHADVISEPALELFAQSAVKVSYGIVVPNIINRKGDGICPLETLCIPCTTAEECLPLITKFINSNKKK
jgi:Domain of unknown function (DUF1893).